MISTAELWYKHAVVYSLDVETFQDSDGDGIGDFAGLTARLDYLNNLGVTCLWLLPFYPSPNRDNGYDVTDYYGVDPRLGTLGDFVDFMRAARERGIRVLIDLVVNHTSDQHPWFQAARADPRSKYRDYYVWAEERPANWREGVVFPGVQEGVWSYDERAGLWYMHRFYEHQPDLNLANPAVRDEIRKIVAFWLELGVSGFRVDAAPFLIEFAPDAEAGYALLRNLRAAASWRRGDAVLLAEANVEAEQIPHYFGDEGDVFHLLFGFLANQHLFLALARGAAAPLADTLRALPPAPPTGQWANFLRNHDELDLGRLTDAERDEAFRAFAPEERMRLYGRGVRRRLAPMLGNDRRRLELAYSVMLALPGTPVLRYGDEIGMGDDLTLRERESVRTPMQWSDAANAGFSTAPADRLVRPVIRGGEYGCERVNAERAQRDPGSLLAWTQRAVRARRECVEIGAGRWEVLDAGDPAVLALRYDWPGRALVVAHNLSDRPVTAALALGDDDRARPVDVHANREYPAIAPGAAPIELDAWGYRWIRLPHPG